MLAIILVPVVALILGAAAPELWAEDDCEDLEFEAWFNIEFNATDEDLGVRGFFDGDPWQEVEIEDPDGRTIAKIKARKSMADQGFAELFFESGEPTLEEVSIETFLGRFPEGTYEFEAETIDECEVEVEAEFTHVLPCPPANLYVTGYPFIITWDAVTQMVDLEYSEPDNVDCTTGDLEIVGYRVEVEWEEELSGKEIVHKFGVDLDAGQSSLTLPPEFIPWDVEEFQYEVLAIEASGNQTITEKEWPEESEED
jgi:hypothetical protein